MKRDISLYIADRLVDLDDKSFILFNHTMDDLTSPAIVKNSFSQVITIPGTANNNNIFGSAFRLDRTIADTGGNIGVDFNHSRKTPFVIYDSIGNILESGYARLDRIDRNGADIKYGLSLFGGLGSFLFALSYDQNGVKRTLADIDYLGTGNTESELDFDINATNVRNAWDTIQEGGIDSIWKVINFAPAFNGIPEGNFDAKKGIVIPSEVGLQDTIGDYTLRSGLSLVTLAEAHDEWAVKDLRSYLQRPVFSIKAFLEALKKPENNGGYELDTTSIESLDFRYQSLWMTLPLLSSLGSLKQATGDLSVAFSAESTTEHSVGRYDIVGSVGSGTKMTADLNFNLRYNIPAPGSVNELTTDAYKLIGGQSQGKQSVLFLQVIAYSSADTIIGGSKIKVIGQGTDLNTIVSACGYVPLWGDEGYEWMSRNASFSKVSTGLYQLADELRFQVTATDAAYYRLMVTAYEGEIHSYRGGSQRSYYSYRGDGSSALGKLFDGYDTEYVPTSATSVAGQTANSVAYTSSSTLRSGARITKRMLLSSSHTPADYLLSLCKVFGLYMVCDKDERKVTILRRNDLYRNQVMDITERVDPSKGISIVPMVFTSKWYDFSIDSVGGAFMDEYRNSEGVEYGIQRVNTGYDFNADPNNLMDSVVFRNACTILGRSRYFNYIFNRSKFIPSVFVDKGNKYTLWSATGETLDTDISCPPTSAVITYYNEDFPGYDITTARKLEMRDANGKPLDGENVLVFWEGFDRYPYFKLTDDTPEMNVLNDGVPCWILSPGDQTGISIPTFSRYKGDESIVEVSLDFGVPRQLDIPRIVYRKDSTIYERSWKKYLEDRFNVNTKVMTCWLDMSGIQVGQDLLRGFYWYDGAIWALNTIRNYSLNTFDPVECEFIQVQDIENYTEGQR